MMNRLIKTFAATALFATAVPASAAVTFNFATTSSNVTASSGSGVGNSYTFTSAIGGEHVVVTGFQISQAPGNAVASQSVGAYSPGFGVTGSGDYGGSYGYHQIDNVNGYTDFVLLTFDHAVTLNTIGLASFNMGNASNNSPAYLASKDNDLAYMALAGVFSAGAVTTSGWSTVNGSGADGIISTGSSAVSKQWLVGAAFNSGSNDGFKISSLSVSAVPEPGTWALMLVGFGAMGVSLRTRRRKVVARFA